MSKKVRSTINYTSVALFIFLGLLGIILPILPGLVFILIALVILSCEVPAVDEWLEKHIIRFPKYEPHFRTVKVRVQKYF
ncbi:MAG: hypothetical protein QG614_336 [Patescibacteria group bacterium]|nr:hypothetical protein [Patescibacteria group bacterium]